MATWSLAILALALAGGAVLIEHGVHMNLPGDDTGYGPVQPIAFSHRLHCTELQMRCQYCHTGVDQSRHAGIPAAATCMNCHHYVSAASSASPSSSAISSPSATDTQPEPLVSPELAKLYEAVGFDALTRTCDPLRPAHPIEWIKVHDLPDFVCFDHSRHVVAGVDCQECHGDVKSMDRIVQVRNFNMGMCVNCHRDVQKEEPAGVRKRNPSTDCGDCHY